jgi:hypothetical protein
MMAVIVLNILMSNHIKTGAITADNATASHRANPEWLAGP